MLTHLREIGGHAAAAFGDKTAMIVEDRRFTFRELDRLDA